MRNDVNEDVRWTVTGSDNKWKKWTRWNNKKTKLKLKDKTDTQWTKRDRNKKNGKQRIEKMNHIYTQLDIF